MRLVLSVSFLIPALALASCSAGSGKRAATVATTPAASLPTLSTAEALRYDKAMLRLGAKLGKTVDGLYPLDTGTPGSTDEKQTIAKLDRAHRAVSSVERSLGQIEPPAAIAAEHRTLRKNVHAVARQIAALATSLRTGDTDAFNALSQLPALAGVTAETDAIRQKGYDVLGPNS